MTIADALAQLEVMRKEIHDKYIAEYAAVSTRPGSVEAIREVRRSLTETTNARLTAIALASDALLRRKGT